MSILFYISSLLGLRIVDSENYVLDSNLAFSKSAKGSDFHLKPIENGKGMVAIFNENNEFLEIDNQELKISALMPVDGMNIKKADMLRLSEEDASKLGFSVEKQGEGNKYIIRQDEDKCLVNLSNKLSISNCKGDRIFFKLEEGDNSKDDGKSDDKKKDKASSSDDDSDKKLAPKEDDKAKSEANNDSKDKTADSPGGGIVSLRKLGSSGDFNKIPGNEIFIIDKGAKRGYKIKENVVERLDNIKSLFGKKISKIRKSKAVVRPTLTMDNIKELMKKKVIADIDSEKAVDETYLANEKKRDVKELEKLEKEIEVIGEMVDEKAKSAKTSDESDESDVEEDKKGKFKTLIGNFKKKVKKFKNKVKKNKNLDSEVEQSENTIEDKHKIKTPDKTKTDGFFKMPSFLVGTPSLPQNQAQTVQLQPVQNTLGSAVPSAPSFQPVVNSGIPENDYSKLNQVFQAPTINTTSLPIGQDGAVVQPSNQIIPMAVANSPLTQIPSQQAVYLNGTLNPAESINLNGQGLQINPQAGQQVSYIQPQASGMVYNDNLNPLPALQQSMVMAFQPIQQNLSTSLQAPINQANGALNQTRDELTRQKEFYKKLRNLFGRKNDANQ